MKVISVAIYRFVLIFFLSVFISACSDSDFTQIESEGILGVNYENEFSLDFTVTLDALGESPTRSDNFNPMREKEDFIDPQKFRVLFFDGKGKFLFESKSRWVKKLDKTPDDMAYKRWYVSVPIFTYGDDVKENWNWEKIKEALTDPNGGGFKISLLVNRPLNEYTSDYAGNGIDGGETKGWFPNNSPNWSVSDSRFDENGNENPKCKTIFDLHHCQFDPIYQNKGKPSGWKGEGFYNFIMGDAPNGVNDPVEPKLSPFVSWVNWHGENDTKKNQVTVNGVVARKALLPTEEHPIPMYGVQNYDYIPESEWERGNTFNLTRETDKPVSLLRSSVKIELVLPNTKTPDMVLLMYSNIYSRCEPMDVWTPTNEIWKEHNDGCEWQAIQNYGPMVYKGDPSNPSGSNGTFVTYRNRLSWLYGAWKEDKWWDFDSDTKVTVPSVSDAYPRIFNPCIQRNNAVYVYGDKHTDTKFEDELKNIHIIAYTGERNLNDPSKLQDMSGENVGARTMIFWVLIYGKKLYPLPIADYSNTGNNDLRNIGSGSYDASSTANLSTMTNTTALNNYANNMATTNYNKSYRPWPLIRNHVYKLNIGSIKTKGENNQETLNDLFITSEDLFTPDITYDNVKIKSAELVKKK